MKIASFHSNYAPAFYDLNIEWLETYFYVEPFDKEVLSKPQQYIIDKGGHIFFAIENKVVLGTIALMPYSEVCFELTKMAVLPKHRGKKIGHQLLQHCIEFAMNTDKELLLYSNTKLENAIYLYRKFGFQEIELEPGSPYKRSNIKMQYFPNR